MEDCQQSREQHTWYWYIDIYTELQFSIVIFVDLVLMFVGWVIVEENRGHINKKRKATNKGK